MADRSIRAGLNQADGTGWAKIGVEHRQIARLGQPNGIAGLQGRHLGNVVVRPHGTYVRCTLIDEGSGKDQEANPVEINGARVFVVLHVAAGTFVNKVPANRPRKNGDVPGAN